MHVSGCRRNTRLCSEISTANVHYSGALVAVRQLVSGTHQFLSKQTLVAIVAWQEAASRKSGLMSTSHPPDQQPKTASGASTYCNPPPMRHTHLPDYRGDLVPMSSQAHCPAAGQIAAALYL